MRDRISLESIESVYGTPADNFHVESRNRGYLKHFKRSHLVHFEPRIQRLVSESPLKLRDKVRLALPKVGLSDDVSFWNVVRNRRSGREYRKDGYLELEELAALLFMGNGVRRTLRSGKDVAYSRNVPNSGGLGSVEVFVVLTRVNGISPGLYHYDSVTHEIVLLERGDFSAWLSNRVFFQIEHAEGAAVFWLTSAVGRLQEKYGLRGYRLGLMDVGHVSENLQLGATALGLEVCASAGFIDEEVDRAFGLDGIELATFLAVVCGHG